MRLLLLTQAELLKLQSLVAEERKAREKELTEFNAEEKDLIESIDALKAAITVLLKHHVGSLLHRQESKLISIAAR